MRLPGILKKDLLDPFQGIEDIKNKQIRCVGNPHKRFEEDALRILRALRFHCTTALLYRKKDKRGFAKKRFFVNLYFKRANTK